MTLEPEPRPVRAGDAERSRTNEVLARAFAAGQLTQAEFDERSTAAWTAVHLTDLDGLVADLGTEHAQLAIPTPSAVARPAAPATDTASSIGLSLALMSGISRTGAWRTSETHLAVAIMGGVEVDLREADFDVPHTTIHAFAFWGGVEVVVPSHVRVQVEGFALMGGFAAEGPAVNPADLPADAPVVTVRGLALMGGVGVTRKGYGET